MKKFLSFFCFLAFSIIAGYAQNNVCEGSIHTADMAVYGSGTTLIGNGTPGSIQVCVSSPTMSTCNGNPGQDRVAVYNSAGTLVAFLYNTSSCYTLTTTDGYAQLAFQDFCGTGGGTYVTWTTLNSCGANACNPLPVYNMSTSSVTTCGAMFYDAAGCNSNYAASQNTVQTFCPSTAGSCIQIRFISFALQATTNCASDYFKVYDGNTTGAPVLGTYCGTTLPPTLKPSNTNTSGCLTIEFVSDGSTQAAGWRAEITCGTCPAYCPTDPCPSGTTCNTATNTCDPTCNTTSPVTPPNNCISAAELITDCGVSFYTCNFGATADCLDGHCGGTKGKDYNQNLDCNNTTGTDGNDVGYSVENDIYYKFCPTATGMWTLTIEPSQCTSTTYGYQYGVFQGTETNLHTLVAGGTGGQNLLGTVTVSFNVTNTTDCFFIQIDGYGGVQCVFALNVGPDDPAAGCALATNGVTICSGETATLTASGSGGTFNWYDAQTGGNLLFTGNPFVTPVLTTNTTYWVSETKNGVESATTSVTVTVKPLPVAAAATTTSALCVGETISLQGSSSMANSTFSWTGPNSFTSTDQNPSIANATTAMSGTYSLTVVADGCSSAVSTVSVTVNALPAAPTASGTTICSGNTATLTATAPGGTYEWFDASTGGTLLATASSYTTPVLSVNTTYYVQTTDANGCVSPRTAVTVTVNPTPSSPTATYNDTPPLCEGSTIALSATAVTGATYSWTGPNSFTSTAQNPSISNATTSMSGIYSVVAIVNACTSAVATVNVTINENPVITSITETNPSSCGATDGEITINATGLGLTYSIDGGVTFVSSNIFTGLAAGSYSIEVMSSAGCSAQGSVSLTSPGAPATPSVSSTTNPLCQGATLTISVDSPNATYTYNWTGPNGYTSTNTTSITINNVTTAMAGTYSVTATESGCVSDAGTIVIQVNANPVLNITNPPAVCSPATVDITAAAITSGSTGSGTLTYWTDAGATTALTTPTAVSASGTYYIKSETASGCIDIEPVVVTINATPDLITTNPAAVCSPSTVDLTAASVTSGSTGGGTLTYWTDVTATTALSSPSAVATSGTYYIQSTLGDCSDIEPVTVTINTSPVLTITDPAAVCAPLTVDLTAPAVTSGSTGGGTLTYWTDAGATTALSSPSAVATSGTYYIQSTITATGCSDIKPVVVTINPTPVLTITNPAAVCSPLTVDLTDASVTSGSTGGTTLTYWEDAGATIPLSSPNAVTASGIYYIQATTPEGCSDIQPVDVTINASPVLAITDPDAVCSPLTVDLTAPAVTSGSTGGGTLTYWTDATATTALSSPNAVATSGSYYIQTTVASTGCSDIKLVNVTISAAPVLTITNPASVCSPSTVDLTDASVTSGSTGGGTLTYWEDAGATILLSSPNAVTASGTYYIQATAAGGCYDIKPVDVTINTSPILTITNPAAVCSPSTIDLTAASVTSGSTGGGNLTYWTDANATTSLSSPNAVSTSATYYIQSTVAATGCSDIQPVVVTINPTPAAPIASSPTYCQGDQIADLTATVNGGTVTWYSDPGLTNQVGTGSPFASGATTDSTFYVTGTVSGCEGPETAVTITINPIPAAPDATSPAPYCEGEQIAALTATGTGGTFTWYADADLTTPVGTGSPFTPVTATTRTYYVTENNGCESPATAVTVTIDVVNALFTATPQAGMAPLNVEFLNSSTTASSYLWNFGNGDTATTLNASTVYSEQGTYEATLIAYGSNQACTDTFKITLLVEGESVINVPNVFSPNGDGKNDVFKADAVNITSIHGEIFNRWGTKLYTWEDINSGWDGRTTGGKECEDGTYFYIIKVTSADKEYAPFTGSVTLVR